MRLAYFPKNEREALEFRHEFERQGVDFQAFQPPDVWIACNNTVTIGAGPRLTLQDLESPDIDTPFRDFDIVFQRSVPSWNQTYGPEIVHFFFDALYLAEKQTPVVNPPTSTILARRKHLAAALLRAHGIPVPPFFASPSPIRNMRITRKTPPPAIVKTLEGAGGIGVLLAPDLRPLGDIISLFHKNQQVPIIQPYLPCDHDLRVFVLGNQIIGAIRRRGTIHKHNISLGATASNVPPKELPTDLAEYALAAAQHLSLHIAGVDFLTPPTGPLLLEVNPSPGFHALAPASKTNIPRLIVAHLIRLAKT